MNEKGKPPERVGRKVMGLRYSQECYDRQTANLKKIAGGDLNETKY